MKNQIRKHTQGFTIIEVMIVLAIAGLILAVVLLAVPALQRSQRNNARQSDATHWAGLISDYSSNHGGLFAGLGASYTAPATEHFSQLLSPATVVSAKVTVAGITGASPAVSTSVPVIDTGVSCDNTTSPVTITAAANSFAVFWQTEPNNDLTCLNG